MHAKSAWQYGGMKSRRATHTAAMDGTDARPLASLYVAGPFSMGYVDFFTFLDRKSVV